MTRRKTLTVNEAVERLREAGMSISLDTLRRGIEDRVFPFGIFVRTKESTAYWVSPKKLDAWIADFIG